MKTLSRLSYIWLVLFGSWLRAGTESAGTTSMNFLKLGSGARAEGLAGAFTGLADDASCLRYNPAGMSRLLHGEIQATHGEWLQGFHFENLDAIVPLGEGGMLGLSFNALISPTMTRAEQVAETDDPSQNYILGENFTPLDFQGALSYSRPTLPGLLAGGTLKLMSETLADKTALGLAMDIGLLFQTGLEPLSLGAVAKNIGLPARMGSQSFNTPFEFSLGGALKFWRGQGRALLELDLPQDSAPALAGAVEWDFDDVLQPRMGWRYDQGFNPWSAGLGVKLGTWGLDFSAVPAGELGMTYRGSLYWRFGGPTAKLLGSGSVVSPGGKGGEGLLQPVVTAPDKVASWALYIYSPSGSRFRPVLARSLTGKGPLPARLSWDGQNENGQPAADGTYRAILSLRYLDDEVVYSPPLEIIVAGAPVKAVLELDPSSRVSVDSGRLYVPSRFNVRAADARPMKSWRVEVLDGKGKVFRALKGDWTQGLNADWDGKSDSGEAFVSGQIYFFRLFVTDASGREMAMPEVLKYKAVFRQ